MDKNIKKKLVFPSYLNKYKFEINLIGSLIRLKKGRDVKSHGT